MDESDNIKTDFNALTSEYYQSILKYCNYLLKNQADAEDAAQDTFVKAWKNIDKLNESDLLKNWLFSIARNTCFDRLRIIKKFRNFILGRDLQDSFSPVISESALTLKQAINSLSGQQKEVFILRHIFDFNTAETAKVLKISEGSVKSHLSRAIEKICRIYDNQN